MLFSNKNLPFELLVGLRYTRAKRKNHFISFISVSSMICMAIGVWALIVILSVMNGFHEELQNRTVSVASHLEITGFNGRLSDWNALAEKLKSEPKVLASAPYIAAQAMLSYDQAVQGAVVRGILPAEESKVASLVSHMKVGKLDNLRAGEFNVVLGDDLAYALGVNVGEKVVLMAPQGQFTPAGVVPRLKQFTVVGLFHVGMWEYDAGMALIHLDDAAKLYRMADNVSGLRLKLPNLFDAPAVSEELSQKYNQAGTFYISDWTQQHANFFKALKMEKTVMFIITSIIVLVAAFSILSSLVMAVTDKRADIAIMRTFGASPRSIMKIFVVQGALIGVMGILVGLALGILTAVNIPHIVPWIERTLNVQFLAKDVYFISDIPSRLMWSDVSAIVTVAFIMSILATLYPSYKASKINPAEALRYE
ncbi:MAG TPA: lipoprotein-releasing ABC transporter permease subunit [Methylophilus sp.]|nr:lipoprotein-releasing ABC transporter permease subunit [Methylophilus sp.]HQQ33066.1 lipoprotein-releasing ABC transporter permease subunit [Methylophilus sp.]